MENKMKNKIQSWGRKLAKTFVRKGTNRIIIIKTGKQFGSVHKATVFVAFTNGGELNIQVKRHLDDSGERQWEKLLNVNLNAEEDNRQKELDDYAEDIDQQAFAQGRESSRGGK